MTKLIVNSILFFFSTIAHADQIKWIEAQFPFELRMNMDTVYQITHGDPQSIAQEIKKRGVQILLVKDKETQKTKNPNLDGLEYASEKLLNKAEFLPQYTGRMIPSTNKCCNLKQDLILIKDTADNYTLIHEYLHSLLKFNDHHPIHTIESDFRVIERKQLFYQRKLFEYSENLLNPVWRKDILSVQTEIVSLLSDRFRIGQVQEAIIEKILSIYIDFKNANYEKNRHEQGLKYAEAMINNMITVYNNLHFAINWNKNTATYMHESLKKGDMKFVNAKESLTDKEVKDFVKANEDHLLQLKKVEAEILKLKAFFTK